MRSLYWKIFLSFWLASILIIITTAWVTREIAQTSSAPARERAFMDSYANAAVITFETGRHAAFTQWLIKTGISKHMRLFLLTNQGKIIGNEPIPNEVESISNDFIHNRLEEGLFKSGHLIVSHDILSSSGVSYRLVAMSETPFSHFIETPWADLTARLVLAIFISGLICYLLSIYLTRPLRSLRSAAKSLATGKLNTRVGRFMGHYHDEIAELSDEFDRMAEQLETLVHSKQRLLQDISHELRSPLGRLQIAIELGRQKTDSLAINEFQRMELECVRLNQLIGEVLEFARLDTSPDTLNKTQTFLPTLVQNIIDDANYEFSQKTLRVLTEKMHPCKLFLDERLIRRAIENILRNALHYSPKDQPVTISVYPSPTTEFLFIDIKDNGPGVPDNQLTKIFNPFYRVDTAREKKTGGYGLGLAIALQAVKLHNGQIVAKHRKNKSGLLIRIQLPFCINSSSQDAPNMAFP